MKISDTVVGAGFVGAGALILSATLSFPRLDDGAPGPALFPQILGTLMAVFGGLVAVEGLRVRDVGEELDWRGLHRSVPFLNALFVLTGVVAYLLLVERLGFLVMGAVVVFVLMWRLRVAILQAAVVAVLFTNLVYLLFAKILRVPLAPGLLWW